MPTKNITGLNSQRVLLFVRAPQRGRVKTRLAARLGADKTLALYRCFVEDIMATLNAGLYQPSIFYTPKDQKSVVQAWLGRNYHCLPQSGSNLGERMYQALRHIFHEPVKRAVLIGSDIPDLSTGIIAEAFAALQESDVVIGPAKDGGYYLIGFQKDALSGDVFNGMEWGTNQVFQQTLVQLQHANLSYHILPICQDIDTYEDLMAFYSRNASRQSPKLKSMTLITKMLQHN